MLTEGGDPCGNGRGRRTEGWNKVVCVSLCASVTVRPFVSICPPSRFSLTRYLFDFLSLSSPPPPPSRPSLCLLMAAEFRKLVRLLETKSSENFQLMQTVTHADTHTHTQTHTRVPRPPLKVRSQIECSLLLKINQSSINGDGVCVCLCVCLSVCVCVCGKIQKSNPALLHLRTSVWASDNLLY